MNAWRKWAIGLALGVALLSGCGGQAAEPADPADALALLSRPTIAAAALDNRPLRVVATTSLVGEDVYKRQDAQGAGVQRGGRDRWPG